MSNVSGKLGSVGSLRLEFENSRFSAGELDLRKIAQMRIRPLDYVRNLTLATKLLLCLWLVFGSLVAFGIHGSSIAETAQFWAPEIPTTDTCLIFQKYLSAAILSGEIT